ncbi:uncharacterized protein SPAPADRAFT_60941 [Spathaspora passalidarum NRRL Y-27907]|uniref:MHD domain-containing protein n=1 Tax=Spathaspora passalidarum (strain NRRL Y-27907 / 11-Y1) TaxID=619300 RepID=G3AKK1_SPAPN|nr:uncharacterized protein SPAPADRAFT_60941 [Spathaspora passalidarum NRRL Y-27907]EGW33606.1 hypothetical protein SPAPADRAFT_60941 [Spathaspora passalidarum NRRL Y-27907]
MIEDCEFIYDLSTNIIKRNEIYGTCVVKSYLSGMPICRVGFNEKHMTLISESEVTSNEEIPKNQLQLEDDNDEEEEVALEDSEEPSDKSKSRRKIPIGNIQFHQCIELSKVYKDNLVTFIPPDDKFILMTYNVDQQKQKRKLPLIMVKPKFKVINQSHKLQIMCVINTNFNRRRHCKNLYVKIPINQNHFQIRYDGSDSLKYKAELGEVSYKVDSSEIVWRIDSIDGKKTARMMAEVSLLKEVSKEKIDNYVNRRIIPELSTEVADIQDNAKQELDEFYGVNKINNTTQRIISTASSARSLHDDIELTFQIPMMTYSGLKLTYLSVEEEQLKYPCFPWVRYITKSSHSDTSRGFTGRQCYYRFKLGVDNFIVE